MQVIFARSHPAMAVLESDSSPPIIAIRSRSSDHITWSDAAQPPPRRATMQKVNPSLDAAKKVLSDLTRLRHAHPKVLATVFGWSCLPFESLVIHAHMFLLMSHIRSGGENLETLKQTTESGRSAFGYFSKPFRPMKDQLDMMITTCYDIEALGEDREVENEATSLGSDMMMLVDKIESIRLYDAFDAAVAMPVALPIFAEFCTLVASAESFIEQNPIEEVVIE